jgi:hypothetical protein
VEKTRRRRLAVFGGTALGSVLLALAAWTVMLAMLAGVAVAGAYELCGIWLRFEPLGAPLSTGRSRAA